MNYGISQSIIVEQAFGHVLETPWPTEIPVVYEGRAVGIAQFDGARYIYNLVGEMEAKRDDGSVDAKIEFDMIEPGTDLKQNIRIARIRLFDKSDG